MKIHPEFAPSLLTVPVDPEPQMNFVWVVCAWCDQEFATRPCDPEVHGDITHGVCSACKAGWIRTIPTAA